MARLLPLVVLLAVAGATAGAFLVTRHVERSQERRLLDDRAREVAASLSSSVAGTQSALQVLGSIASSPDRAEAAAFSNIAGAVLTGDTAGLGVATASGTHWRQSAAAGAVPAVGSDLPGGLASLCARAIAARKLVAAVLTDGSTREFALALPTANGSVIYDVTRVATPVPAAAANAEFGDLDVAVYAAPTADPRRLVITTSRALPSGRVVHKQLAVGADRWLVAVSSPRLLGGSLAQRAPWIILGVGLALALLSGVVAEVLARRRAYALALVTERTAELRAAREAADRANQSKSEFLSRMSHELRTPLNAVLGFGQLLELEELSAEQSDAVDHILKGGRHLLALIDEVLDITRIETGSITLSPEAVLVRDLLGEVLDLMRPLAHQRGIQMSADPSSGWELHAFADRQRTKQILLNLVSNAIKYNRQRGSVRVTCRAVDDGTIEIGVADTGPGLRADQLDLLFVPFERLGAEHSDVEGTGIGLALSKRLADAMCGELRVESVPGQGTTFFLELPGVEGPVERYERLQEAGLPAQSAPASPSAAHRVLYIEDNLSNLKLVRRVLARRPGLDVVAAMQGGIGLDLAREHRPLLVMLDLHLPDMPGEQVLRRLRDDPATSSVPVIIVSADASTGQAQRLLSAGAAAYLTKPIEVRELLRVLDETLANV